MKELLWDCAYGLRLLRKSPSFAVIAVVTLALGIGASSIMFSLVNGIILHPLPYPESDRITAIWVDNPKLHLERNSVSYQDFADWRSQSRNFAALSAYTTTLTTLLDPNGYPEQLRVTLATADLAQVIGVSPFLGRFILETDDQFGAAPVAVISHSLWRRRFGADAKVLNQKFQLDKESYTVVGVMPADRQFPLATDIWLPLKPNSDAALFDQRGSRWLRVVGRMAPGTDLSKAQAEMVTIGSRLQQQYPGINRGWEIHLTSLREYYVGGVGPVLIALLGAVVFVLLISCANLASLLLARNSSREPEVAIRLIMGASRGRLIRQFLTESLVLSVLGGLAGFILAFAGLPMLMPLLRSAGIPRVKEVAINGPVILFAVGLIVLTTFLFGSIPAFRSLKANLNEGLGVRSAGGSSSGSGRTLRKVFISAETALSMVLLMSAGLMINSFLRLRAVSPGFNPDHVLTFSIDLHAPSGSKQPPSEASLAAFYSTLADRLSEIPSINSVGAVSTLPMTNAASTRSFGIHGRPTGAGEQLQAGYDVADGGYFQVMQIPLIRGRVFSRQDQAKTEPVAIVNQEFVDKFFPDENAVGKVIITGKNGGVSRTIVGIVGNIRHEELYLPVRAEIYVPVAQDPWPFLSFVLRSGQDPAMVFENARQAAGKMSSTTPIFGLDTVSHIVDSSIVQRRLDSIVMAFFASIALLLAAVGIYGIMSYTVSLRRHEIGIRLALGASPELIRNMVLREGAYLALAGIAIGLGGGLFFTRLLRNMLYGLRQNDPTTFFAVGIGLVLVTMLASYVPSRRATKIDPIVVIRHQ